MELTFIIITIFVIIVTINISITAGVEYDIVKNIGKITLKIFKIPFFKSEISLIAGYFNLVRKNKKVLQIKIDFNDKNFKFLKDIGKYFTKKVYVTHLDTTFEISGNDPALISVLAGYVIVVEGYLRSYISSKSPDTALSSNTKVKFNGIGLKFKINLGILITIFDFIWAIIRAIVKRSVYGKAKVRRNSQFNY